MTQQTRRRYPGLGLFGFFLICLALLDVAMLSYIIEVLDKEEWDPALAEAGDTSGEWLIVIVLTVAVIGCLAMCVRILRNPVIEQRRSS